MLLLPSEVFGHSAVFELGVFMAGCHGSAAIAQPFIQFVDVGKLQTGNEEAMTDELDLTFYLSFLPAGCRGTGYRLKQIGRREVLKTPIEDSILPYQYLGHNRLEVVIYSLAAASTKILKGPNMGIKHHLKTLSGIGNAKRHPTVAEAEVGYLYCNNNTGKFNLFIAPVKLECFPRVEGLRYVCRDLFVSLADSPFLDIATDAVISTFKPLTL